VAMANFNSGVTVLLLKKCNTWPTGLHAMCHYNRAMQGQKRLKEIIYPTMSVCICILKHVSLHSDWLTAMDETFNKLAFCPVVPVIK
jgi:hypothetical protein